MQMQFGADVVHRGGSCAQWFKAVGARMAIEQAWRGGLGCKGGGSGVGGARVWRWARVRGGWEAAALSLYVSEGRHPILEVDAVPGGRVPGPTCFFMVGLCRGSAWGPYPGSGRGESRQGAGLANSHASEAKIHSSGHGKETDS